MNCNWLLKSSTPHAREMGFDPDREPPFFVSGMPEMKPGVLRCRGDE
jgi:hypothetical protein